MNASFFQVVTKLPSSSLWATLFFAMLISLALGSIFGAFETVITACTDQWPKLRHYKPQLVIALALLMTILGHKSPRYTAAAHYLNDNTSFFTRFDIHLSRWCPYVYSV